MSVISEPLSRPRPFPVRAPSASPRARVLRVGLMGLGTVGQSLAALLSARRADFARRHGVAFEIAAVLVRDVTRRRGLRPAGALLTDDPAAFLAEPCDVAVEAIGGVERAGSLVAAFLDRGVPVVTANKALLAERAPDLAARARAGGTVLKCEASVAAGIPLLALLDRALQSTTVSRVEAVLNATSHFVLSRISGGTGTLDEALAEARAAGYAEADARLDTSGYDAAQKLAVLAWALFGRSLPWTRVEIEGIDGVTAADAEAARALDGCLKPVALADFSGPSPVAFVAPAFVPESHPLASIAGAQNGIRLLGDTIDELFLAGPGAGGPPTAAALADDLLAVARGESAGPPPRVAAETTVPLAAPGSARTPWFLSIGRRLSPGALRRRVAAAGLTVSAGAASAALVSAADRPTAERLASRLPARAFRQMVPGTN